MNDFCIPKALKRFFLLAALSPFLILFEGCKPAPPSDVNIELADHPKAKHLLAPGRGTIGIIEEGAVNIFYLDKENQWVPDPDSRFTIPEKNQGILAMGDGTIGVRIRGGMHFYKLSASQTWEKDPALTFDLPRRYGHMLSVKMPWETGILAFERDRYLEFYYHEDGEWLYDETALFSIPEGITHYFSMGNMTIAIVEGGKLGLYYLHPEGDWRFLEDHVLRLPDAYDAIIPYEMGVIAILKEQQLDFYELNLSTGRWSVYEEVSFQLPKKNER